MTMTYGSLFSGIGGFEIGLRNAGMKCLWQVEIDDFCNVILEKRFEGEDIERYKDIRKCGKHNLHPVDLVVGGFPCQPHSVAGKQRGADDDRNLWPEFLRIITEIRPSWIIAENVPGIRRTILDDALSNLENLGYTCEAIVVPAVSFDARHKRDRVWIVGYTEHDGQSPAEIARSASQGSNAGSPRAGATSEPARSGQQLEIVAYGDNAGDRSS